MPTRSNARKTSTSACVSLSLSCSVCFCPSSVRGKQSVTLTVPLFTIAATSSSRLLSWTAVTARTPLLQMITASKIDEQTTSSRLALNASMLKRPLVVTYTSGLSTGRASKRRP